MAAYGSIATSKPKIKLHYLPLKGKTKSGLEVKLVEFEERFEKELHQIMKKIVDDGQTYPFENMDSIESFRAYYVSDRCFVCLDNNDRVLGGFYVKPNFPGRCDHIANAGFIVGDEFRGLGVGKFMVPQYLQIARDLGYEASYYNLVFDTNPASLRLWESFGFQAVGRIPRAGRLEGLGYVDAINYYYDLTTIDKTPGLEQ